MQLDTVEQALAVIKEAGHADDSALNLFVCGLAFARLFHPNRDVAPYLEHMESMSKKLRDIFDQALYRGGEDSIELRHHCLIQVLHEDFGYTGDEENYADPVNADLMAVVDRRRGLPVALGILYLHLASEMEWEATGLNFPGHFLLRLSHGSESVIVDPFRDGIEVNAADMRRILKAIAGQAAELSHNYYDPLDSHNVMLRLQNNLKNSLVERERYEEAIILVEALRVFDPDEHRLLFDASILKVKAGQVQAARDDIMAYLERVPGGKDRVMGEQLLYEIQRSLN